MCHSNCRGVSAKLYLYYACVAIVLANARERLTGRGSDTHSPFNAKPLCPDCMEMPNKCLRANRPETVTKELHDHCSV